MKLIRTRRNARRAPARIAISQEEITADLLYPARSAHRHTAAAATRGRRR